MSDPERLLIRLPTWVGDAVMATPALRAVRRDLPHTRIALMGGAPLEPLLADAGLFDDWVATASGSGEVAANIAAIEDFGADVALLLPHSFRTAWEIWRASVPRRIGLTGQFRGWLLTDPLRRHRLPQGRRAIPMHHEYLEVVASLGASGDGIGSKLGVSEEVVFSATRRLDALSIDSDRNWIGFHPGAAFGPSKIWPLDRMAMVARTLRDDDGCGIVITCGPGEEPLARKLRDLVGGEVVDLSEDLWPLDQLKVLMGRLALLVTGDTGPRHIAAGMGTPQVVLMGPTSPDYTDAYLETTSVIRREDVDCSPCQQKVCPLGHHQCMTFIEPEAVIEEVRRWLARASDFSEGAERA
ncbi:MAG: lipopolysaccharide heptosyltransferase II [Planctomycetes bacterium]|nr:lipopolysaccharide heptosyltransferase II [Planctomycetota bacterium]MBT6452164.1 lipopolysaccharide heptosyltransferase II [Planctomycetota bacterium]MBT6540333.1 lipopolysaccharide heptosyltransferase II [Planctomycetota bacterium]MBT6967809.1 lipopolysaccharide heptosyltransferase II [Planctomycetota bacterium]MBT7103585.1 lipopolysaccharide heptosyltransferase II [Planctomycetota bacterium]